MTFFISVGRTVGGDLSVSRSEQTVATADHGQRSDLGVHDHMWRAMRSTMAMGDAVHGLAPRQQIALPAGG